MDLLSTIIEAFNFMQDGIAIVTIEGTVLYYNRVWLDIHALDSSVDYTGMRLRDLEREQIHPILDEGRESLLREGVFTRQFGTTRRDGKYHVVHIVASLVDHLEPPLVVIVLREVTDLVKVQEELEAYRDRLEELVRQRTAELQRSTELLQNEIEERERAEKASKEATGRFVRVVDEMPVMMDAVDETGLFLAWNRECERVTGYGAGEIVGNPNAIEVLYPNSEYRDRMMHQWMRCGDYFREWELDITCRDGSTKTIAWSNVSSKAPIPGWFAWAIGVDVTERKKAEKALRESEERMRAQYKGIPIPTYTWQRVGDDFVLIGYNDAAETATKENIRKLLGAKVSDLCQSNPEICLEMRKCFDERSSFMRERSYKYISTGEVGHFIARYAFIPPDLVVIHTEDITERKAAEEEINRYQERLEDLVDERTVELKDVNDKLLSEIAERQRTEKVLEKRNRELRILNEAYQIIVTSKNVDEILQRILHPVMMFCGAELGGLYRLDYKRNELVLISSNGIEEGIIERIRHISMDVRSIRNFMDSDIVLVAEEDMPGVHGDPYEEIKEHLGVKRTMAFFFKMHGEAVYMAMLGRRSDENVPQGIRDFLEIVGNQISLAVERLELFDALERSKTELKNLTTRLIESIEEERRQIALSLHDETSQKLAAVKNELELLKNRIPAGDSESVRSLEEVKSHLLNIAEGTRSISYSLHPSMLEDLGLIPALNWYAEKFVRSKILRVTIESIGFDSEPPLNVGLALYRVAQEALANVVRHANAKRVKVKLTKGYPDIIMVVEDDGKGFSSGDSRIPGTGLGIIGMRERIEGLGGKFLIRSATGKGTRIRVTIPLEVDTDG